EKGKAGHGKRRVLRARNRAGETRFCASVSVFHQTSNLIHQTCPNGFIQLSLRPHFDHPGLGNDAGPCRRRRDATGALASPALLGTRRLGRESVSVFDGGVVDFLSLAQSTAVDIFPFYLCPDFTDHLVSRLYRSFSARVFFG